MPAKQPETLQPEPTVSVEGDMQDVQAAAADEVHVAQFVEQEAHTLEELKWPTGQLDTHAPADSTLVPTGHEVHADAEPEHVAHVPEHTVHTPDKSNWPAGQLDTHAPADSTLVPTGQEVHADAEPEHVAHETEHAVHTPEAL